ncbi:hypothetical protein B0H19DRAFT_1077782 [Mycena capillaripes]|nr:hypothetical protein B0H19DRAFT_1077782 [Mycena capillaripes]
MSVHFIIRAAVLAPDFDKPGDFLVLDAKKRSITERSAKVGEGVWHGRSHQLETVGWKPERTETKTHLAFPNDTVHAHQPAPRQRTPARQPAAQRLRHSLRIMMRDLTAYVVQDVGLRNAASGRHRYVVEDDEEEGDACRIRADPVHHTPEVTKEAAT